MEKAVILWENGERINENNNDSLWNKGIIYMGVLKTLVQLFWDAFIRYQSYGFDP